MKASAASLLTIFLCGIWFSTLDQTFATTTKQTLETEGKMDSIKKSNTTGVSNVEETTTIKLPVINIKEMLLQEIHTLDDNPQMQEEVARTIIDAGTQKITTPQPGVKNKYSSNKKSLTSKINAGKKSRENQENPKALLTMPSATLSGSKIINRTIDNDQALQELLEAEDLGYDDDDDQSDEDEDDDDDDDDEDDEYDDSDDEGDELEDEEDVLNQCPDHCRCSPQYGSETTARCSKLVDEQNFGRGIAHLRVENAGEVSLGPHALLDRGLLQLESITFTDTHITELDRTAFDGITYLSAVNLTRNALSDIHPQLFLNNTQLSLLTISGNPLRHNRYLKSSRLYILDAPSVTELDYSSNGITRLPINAFEKMTSLSYISLRDNRLKEIEGDLFDPLESLLELDLSNNFLNELPVDLFDNSGLQTLRVSQNNLTTLATIRAPKLTSLEAANNRIRNIAKADLVGLPELDHLVVKSNGLSKIHQHAFSNHKELNYLDISNNKLTSLSEHHFRNNVKLQVLIINDNPELGSLPVFRPAGGDDDDFSVVRFECINCGLNGLEKETFNSMPAITHLYLARNRLIGLPDGLFKRSSSLRKLDLSDNIIDTLSSHMFHGATSLSELNLAGNPLVALQVSTFQQNTNLVRLDVSRCTLERVWSEARVPLSSLRFLSVRGNLLRRITTEELRAMPSLSGLDLNRNPLECNDEFHASIQWLIDNKINPMEIHRHVNDFGTGENDAEPDEVTQWSDVINTVCDHENDGPPPRPTPHKPKENSVGIEDDLPSKKFDEDEITFSFKFDHGVQHDDDVENAWSNQDQEYEDFTSLQKTENNSQWSSFALWPLWAFICATVAAISIVTYSLFCLSKRHGRGPVIRPPMILRPGFVDNKNCGLVYKPLQEEIPTPHPPKRSSFYSSSTFHYDKIVPESV